MRPISSSGCPQGMLAIFAMGWLIIWAVDKIHQINEQINRDLRENDKEPPGWW